MTRYKLESLKLSMKLIDLKTTDDKLRTDAETIYLLITRCALQEYYLEKRNMLKGYHDWLDDQGLQEWVYD